MTSPDTPPFSSEDPGRRGVIATLAMIGGLIISYGTAGMFGLRYFFGRQEPPRTVQVLSAALSEVPEGGSLLAKDLSGQNFFLVRTEGDRALPAAIPAG